MLRLNPVLPQQKGRRDEVGEAKDGLNNRDEGIHAS